MNTELEELLRTFEVPTLRRKDIQWLSRNVWIKNKDNPDLDRVMELIKQELKKA